MKKNMLFFILLFSSKIFALTNGEIMDFSINYGIIHAGDVKMTVSAYNYEDSIATFKVISKAKTTSFFDNFYKVRDHIEIDFRQDNFQSIKYKKELKEGSYRQNRLNYYYPDLGYAIYYKKDKKATDWQQKKYDIPAVSHDIFTTFFKVREMEFAIGDTITTTVSEDGDNTTVQIVVHGIKEMDTCLGKVDCYEIEPQLKGTDSIFKHSGDIFIYLTADESRIPVLLQSQVIFGKFKAILEKYQPGF